MIYPLKFIPIYKQYIWGGRNLLSLGKKLPEGIVAESWELCCHPDGMSIISNGTYAGRTLQSLLEDYGHAVMGNTYKEGCKDFPLMVKFIDANDKLSVQVHPDDVYALENEGESGKNEMWYVLYAKPGASLIYGLSPGVTKEVFKKAISQSSADKYLNSVKVKPGDFFYIPAGLVHAVGEGILLAEIQQNSNLTYRIYDYNRVDSSGKRRALHIEKALDVIDFKGGNQKNAKRLLTYNINGNASVSVLASGPYFCAEIYDISAMITQDTGGEQFHIYVFISGSGSINTDAGSFPVEKGDTVLVPSSIGSYSLKGNMKAIKAYKPSSKIEIYESLMQKGFSKEEIDSVEGMYQF
ncbi:MAG: class I mannose-6-phosphate isomerase [Bacillota bacterium]|jgi:mannose-6-phosphate isomerase|nr:class I mannose-6-phosphate isomerase [Bacillota bacterium]NLV61833.1 class I mannose-6-phosphate isomerase [Clostridiaceae bacterium]